MAGLIDAALILGIDCFISEVRALVKLALVNMIGDGATTIVAACRDSELDQARFEAILSGAPLADMADDRPIPSTQHESLGIDAGVDKALSRAG